MKAKMFTSNYLFKVSGELFAKVYVGCLALILGLVLLSANNISAKTPPASFSDLVKEFGPTVVNIYSTQVIKSNHLPYNYFFDQEEVPELFKHFFDIPPRSERKPLPEQKRTSLGSGVVISADGYIVTNNHVVENADEINVKLANAEDYQAKIIGRDKKTDLALIKIEPKHPLAYAEFGDSDSLEVGDWVLAIGNPFGFEQTVTAGIVSGKGRSLGDGPYQNFIQTDASINPGNSGGPLFNMSGEMMGINTAIYSRSGGNIGLGFAIPANMTKNVINQLKGTGKVIRGMLGVMIQPVTADLAEQFGLDRTIGALVGQVMAGSPAEQSGIMAGDVIIEYNGKEISQMNMLPSLVAQTPIGNKSEIKIFRNGRQKKISVVIGELPEESDTSQSDSNQQQGDESQTNALGIVVREIDSEIAKSLKLRSEDGLLVMEVVFDSPAARSGLKERDIILEAGINNQRKRVNMVKELDAVAKEAFENNANILLLVQSGNQISFKLLKINNK